MRLEPSSRCVAKRGAAMFNWERNSSHRTGLLIDHIIITDA